VTDIAPEIRHQGEGKIVEPPRQFHIEGEKVRNLEKPAEAKRQRGKVLGSSQQQEKRG